MTFKNPGGPVTGTLGDTLSVKGSVDGLPSDFIQAAITGTYSINGAPAVKFNPIVLGFNGRANSFIEELSAADNTVVLQKLPLFNGSLNFNAALATFGPSVTLNTGDAIAFTATVDPHRRSRQRPGDGRPRRASTLPDFGNFTTSPALEPASLISFLVGMSAVGLGIGWRHVAGRKGTDADELKGTDAPRRYPPRPDRSGRGVLSSTIHSRSAGPPRRVHPTPAVSSQAAVTSLRSSVWPVVPTDHDVLDRSGWIGTVVPGRPPPGGDRILFISDAGWSS